MSLFRKKTRSKTFRQDFPLLTAQSIAYLDSGATTHKPQQVLDAEQHYYTSQNANVHRGIYRLAEESTKAYEDARAYIAKTLRAKTEEVIFTSGTTHSMNLAARILESTLQPGDEILVTVAEHHSTFVPFQQLALRTKANFVVVPLVEEKGATKKLLSSTITEAQINKYITPKTKIIAIMQTSNVLGYTLDISKIKKGKAVLVVDAAQAMVHGGCELGAADFIACSGHKAYGPMGIGVLAGKKKYMEHAEPLLYGGSMIHEVDLQHSSWAELPSRFEAGTPNVAGAVGFAAALRYYAERKKDAENMEAELTKQAISSIEKYATILGSKKKNAPIISFVMDKAHGHDIAQILDSFGVCVRAGHHCCEPLHDALGVAASVRVSLGMYNSVEDLQRLEEGLKQVQKVFGR